MTQNFDDENNEFLNSLSPDEVQKMFSDVVDMGEIFLAKGPHCSNSGSGITGCGGGMA